VKKEKNNQKVVISIIAVIILVLIYFIFFNDSPVEIENIKWTYNQGKVELNFEIKNNTNKNLSASLKIMVFSHRLSHNDNYQILAEQNYTVVLSSEEAKKIRKDIRLSVIDKPTKVQVLIEKVR
jgi:hypothetical protein